MSQKNSYFLELNNIHKSYDEANKQRHILKNLSLNVAKGEMVALLGKSGCGKSTLLNVISGIDQVDQGTVRVENTYLNQMSERQRTLFRRKHIGFVFQFFNLIPYISAWQNVLLPLEMNGMKSDEHIERAHKLLKLLHIEQRKKNFPETLSGGERQRIAIARALVHNPKILLADEPTGNLDADSSEAVMNMFSTLIRQESKSALIVTHSLEVAQYCDRIFEMRSGIVNERQK